MTLYPPSRRYSTLFEFNDSKNSLNSGGSRLVAIKGLSEELERCESLVRSPGMPVRALSSMHFVVRIVLGDRLFKCRFRFGHVISVQWQPRSIIHRFCRFSQIRKCESHRCT